VAVSWRRGCRGVRFAGARVGKAGDHPHDGDSVGQAVVNLHQHGPPPNRQALDDPALPQGMIAVQAAFHEVGDQAEQRRIVARGRQSHHAHVVADVEVGVLDPSRRRQIEGVLVHELGEPGHVANAFGQRRGQFLWVRHRPVDDGQCAYRHTHVPVGVLGLQETRFQGGQLFHAPLISASH
jgi:hypothetical protein